MKNGTSLHSFLQNLKSYSLAFKDSSKGVRRAKAWKPLSKKDLEKITEAFGTHPDVIEINNAFKWHSWNRTHGVKEVQIVFVIKTKAPFTKIFSKTVA